MCIRDREAFSDGVSATEKSWSEVVKEYTESIVSSDWKERAPHAYANLTPVTAEQYFYRFHFEANFGKTASSIVPHFWMPRWSPGVTDPSARALALY